MTDKCARIESAEEPAAVPASKPDAPTASPKADEAEAVALLGDVMHLWVDGYISKSPNSCAPNSISGGVFEKVKAFLEREGIEVDYCGWHRVRNTRVAPAPDPRVEAKGLLKRLNEMLNHTYQLSKNEDWDVLGDIGTFLSSLSKLDGKEQR